MFVTDQRIDESALNAFELSFDFENNIQIVKILTLD